MIPDFYSPVGSARRYTSTFKGTDTSKNRRRNKLTVKDVKSTVGAIIFSNPRGSD